MEATGRKEKVIYREATEAELPVIEGMYDEYDGYLRQFTYAFPEVENVGQKWMDTFRRTLGRFSVLYVAEYGSQIVGFIIARLKRVPEYLGGVMIGELKDMWVRPEVRGLGIGEELLRMAIEWCRKQDVYSVEAQILLGNEPILRLVEHLGMKRELYQLRMTWENYNHR